MPGPCDMVLERSQNQPVAYLLSIAISYNLALQFGLLDCFQDLPFMEHEVLVFVIELIDLPLIASDERVEDSSTILLIVPFLIHKKVIFILSLDVQLQKVRLLAKPFTLFLCLFLVCYALLLLVFLFECSCFEVVVDEFIFLRETARDLV